MSKQTKHLLIGMGEIGQAIFETLRWKYEMGWVDKDRSEVPFPKADFIHICIPYSGEFDDVVNRAKLVLDDGGVITIHSTVPIGTSKRLGCVYSPVRGRHPHLLESVKIFLKYFAGEGAEKVGNEFLEAGVPIAYARNTDSLEAAKLWDTTQLGVMVRLEKMIHEHCKQNGLDFELVYKDFNETYNEGYARLGYPHFMRPVYKHTEGPIGGHCVLPNLELLQVDTVSKFVKGE